VACLTLGVVGVSTKKEKVQHYIFTNPTTKDNMTIGWFDGAAQLNGLESGVGGMLRINEHSTYKWTLNCGLGSNTGA
jgi:hypothetical protein